MHLTPFRVTYSVRPYGRTSPRPARIRGVIRHAGSVPGPSGGPAMAWRLRVSRFAGNAGAQGTRRGLRRCPQMQRSDVRTLWNDLPRNPEAIAAAVPGPRLLPQRGSGSTAQGWCAAPTLGSCHPPDQPQSGLRNPGLRRRWKTGDSATPIGVEGTGTAYPR